MSVQGKVYLMAGTEEEQNQKKKAIVYMQTQLLQESSQLGYFNKRQIQTAVHLSKSPPELQLYLTQLDVE